MASNYAEEQPRGSLDFAESSVLEAVVPSNPRIQIEEALEGWDGRIVHEASSILPFISQRQILLLDETISIYVVFRTRLLEHDLLHSYLARLVINIEAFAFSTAPPSEADTKNAPKEVIHSTTLRDTDEPIIVHRGDGDGVHTYIIWKRDIFISRPQGRFHKPAIYFQPTASFKPADKPPKDVSEGEYLPSHVPTALNLLQAFDHDPALPGVHPRLSAMRITKITPIAPIAREMVRPIRNGQRPLFRIMPPLIWRMRYSRIQTSLSDLSLVAALDLEVAPFLSYDLQINSVELKLHTGVVEPLMNSPDAENIYEPGDTLTYLYKLRPDLAADGTPSLGSKGYFLTLNISAQVFMSKRSRPSIAVEWRTPVDFTNEHTSNLIRAAQRLSNATTLASHTPHPDSLPPHDIQRDEPDALAININMTITITGPPRVRVGQIFSWNTFIVNRSDRSRKLAVLVIPKRRRDVEHRSPPTSSSGAHVPSSKEMLAPAVVDENIVYAWQKGARMQGAELICLTTDIRLGQLSPKSCFTADLKFLALGAGVLLVHSVRVVDLVTNETADIHELPSIVAVEGEE